MGLEDFLPEALSSRRARALNASEHVLCVQTRQIARAHRGDVSVPVGVVALLRHFADDERNPGSPGVLVGAVERRVAAFGVAVRPTVSEPECAVSRIVDFRRHGASGRPMIGDGEAGGAHGRLVAVVVIRQELLQLIDVDLARPAVQELHGPWYAISRRYGILVVVL